MAHLETYNNLEEKEEHFESIGMVCGNVEGIFKNLESLLNDNKYLFRGVNNAKYKLYTSAQREFLSRELFVVTRWNGTSKKIFDEWINRLLLEAKDWNKKSLTNYFNSLGSTSNNFFEYLSFMQHNGIPTPLLDFTLDPFVALFFATENVEYNFNLDIESCISLYFINKTTVLNEIINIDQSSEINFDAEELQYEKYLEKIYISIIEHNSVKCKVTNNLNIINQKGCFVFNSHDVNPLETTYSDLVKQLNKGILSTLKIPVTDYKLHCINIHKSLIPKIRKELKDKKGIDKDFIYPNLQLEREKIINNSIASLIK